MWLSKNTVKVLHFWLNFEGSKFLINYSLNHGHGCRGSGDYPRIFGGAALNENCFLSLTGVIFSKTSDFGSKLCILKGIAAGKTWISMLCSL